MSAQQEERFDCPMMLCPCEAPSGVLSPGLEVPKKDVEMLDHVQRRLTNIIESHKDQRAGSPILGRNVKGSL